jgi:hypothetical protein
LHPRSRFIDEPEFAHILDDPSPATAAAVTRQVAATVISIAAIDSPLADEVLRLLDLGDRYPGERQELRARLGQEASAVAGQAKLGGSPEADRLELTGYALVVLQRALEPVATAAARAASLQALSLRVPDREDFKRLIVLRNVSKHIERELAQ